MGVIKLHRIHREVFTATETYYEHISLIRRSGEDSDSENLRFYSQKCSIHVTSSPVLAVDHPLTSHLELSTLSAKHAETAVKLKEQHV